MATCILCKSQSGVHYADGIGPICENCGEANIKYFKPNPSFDVDEDEEAIPESVLDFGESLRQEISGNTSQNNKTAEPPLTKKKPKKRNISIWKNNKVGCFICTKPGCREHLYPLEQNIVLDGNKYHSSGGKCEIREYCHGNYDKLPNVPACSNCLVHWANNTVLEKKQ